MANIPSFATILADVYEIYHNTRYKSNSGLTKALLRKHKIKNDVLCRLYYSNREVNHQVNLIEYLVQISVFWLSYAGLLDEPRDDVNFNSLSFIRDTSAYNPILIKNLYHYIDIDCYNIDKTIQNINYEFEQYAKYLPDDPLLAELKADLLSLLHFNFAEQQTSQPINVQTLLDLPEFTAPTTPLTTDDIEAQLLQRVKALNPTQFEHFALHLIGSIVQDRNDSLDDLITHNGQVGDGGIDGIVKVKRRLGGYDDYFIQCKRYDKNLVGRVELQAFVGSMIGHSIRTGIFITTSKFTKQALEYVEYVEAAKYFKLDLLDGSQLVKYMIAHGIGVKSISQHTIDDEFFKRFERL